MQRRGRPPPTPFGPVDSEAGLTPTALTFSQAVSLLNRRGRNAVFGPPKAVMLRLLKPSLGLGFDPEISHGADDDVQGAIAYWLSKTALVKVWTVRELRNALIWKAQRLLFSRYARRRGIADPYASSVEDCNKETEHSEDAELVEAFRTYVSDEPGIEASRALQLFDYLHAQSQSPTMDLGIGDPRNNPFSATPEREITYHPPIIMAHFGWTATIYRCARESLMALGEAFRQERRQYK